MKRKEADTTRQYSVIYFILGQQNQSHMKFVLLYKWLHPFEYNAAFQRETFLIAQFSVLFTYPRKATFKELWLPLIETQFLEATDY